MHQSVKQIHLRTIAPPPPGPTRPDHERNTTTLMLHVNERLHSFFVPKTKHSGVGTKPREKSSYKLMNGVKFEMQ